MTDFMSSLRGRLAKHQAYRRTVAELERMPLDVALDLDIAPGDIKRIAKESVYGA